MQQSLQHDSRIIIKKMSNVSQRSLHQAKIINDGVNINIAYGTPETINTNSPHKYKMQTTLVLRINASEYVGDIGLCWYNKSKIHFLYLNHKQRRAIVLHPLIFGALNASHFRFTSSDILLHVQTLQRVEFYATMTHRNEPSSVWWSYGLVFSLLLTFARESGAFVNPSSFQSGYFSLVPPVFFPSIVVVPQIWLVYWIKRTNIQRKN